MTDRSEDAGAEDAGASAADALAEGAENVERASARDASASDAATDAEARPSGAGLPQPGEVIAGRYRIEREVGAGGMAVVYAATQLGGGGRQVALKWLFQGRSNRDERRRRFLREARAASSIQHPNVVRVYDAGEHASGVYLVMELVTGEPLSARLARGKLTAREAVDLLMPALRGVAAAHEQGIIHRDLKPDNLFVCARDGGRPEAAEIKVLDFGLSKLVGPAADSLHTLPGTLVGTPQYMAPEQADGRIGAVSERSDVYTLAVILYEAVAGRRPYESETLAGQLMKLAREEPTPLHEVASVPEGFADVIMWALARNPDERPRDVEQLALALEPFGSVRFGDGGRASEGRGSVRAPRRASERAPAPSSAALPAEAATAASTQAKPSRAPLGLAIAALALALAAGGFALSRARTPDAAPDRGDARDAARATAQPSSAATQDAPAALAATTSAPEADTEPLRNDAGVRAAMPPAQPTTEPTEPLDPNEEPAPKRARAPSPKAGAAPPAPDLPPLPPAQAAPEPPSSEPAPRRKHSPGVADPWAD